jgi:hypothetical protein
MKWRTFQEKAPEIASAGAQRFQQSRLALIGTLRLDGWPRISPVEPMFLSEDLLRDPRCVLHSVVTDPDANEGEFKLRGHAMPDAEGRYVEVIRDRWRLAAAASLHVFWIDIFSASLTTYDFDHGLMLVKRWHAERGVSESRRPYP